jgi:hypothetical protein
MRRRILPRILAIGVLVLALAGCVRFQADLSLNPENTVSGNIVVAVILSEDTDEARESTLAGVQQIAAGLLGTLADEPGVTTSEYDQDGYLGERLEFQNVPFTAFSGTEPGALHFERVGDEFVFSGAIDFTDQSATDDAEAAEDEGNLTVKVTFPGAVTEHDGTLSGTTVSWSTPIERAIEMNARGVATAAGPPLALIIGIVAAVLVLAALIAVFLVIRSRRKPAVAPATTLGADAATVAPAQVAPAVASEVPGAPVPPAAPAATTPETPAAPPKPPRAPRAPKAPKAPGTETPPV